MSYITNGASTFAKSYSEAWHTPPMDHKGSRDKMGIHDKLSRVEAKIPVIGVVASIVHVAASTFNVLSGLTLAAGFGVAGMYSGDSRYTDAASTMLDSTGEGVANLAMSIANIATLGLFYPAINHVSGGVYG